MVIMVLEIFACTLRHLVAGSYRFLGAAARLLRAVKDGRAGWWEEGEEGGGNPH